MLPLVLAVLISSEPASAPSSDNEMIRSFCLVAFNAAMEQAGQIPPKGMGDFTCSCFLNGWLVVRELRNPGLNARRKRRGASPYDSDQLMLT